jgi:diguanylate cyclase (GGDEF)-like protein
MDMGSSPSLPSATSDRAARPSLVAVSPSVREARALLPRLYVGEDVAPEADALVERCAAANDVVGQCAALYARMAAAAMAEDLDRARTLALTLVDVGGSHTLSAWEATARQYLARLHLNADREDLALTEVVAAELLVDDLEPSVELSVALNGIGLAYSRLGLYEDSERIFARLDAISALVDDDWTRFAMGHNRLLNQAGWGLALARIGDAAASRERLRIAAAQARASGIIAQSDARYDFGALCLFADLLAGEIDVPTATERFAPLRGRASAEPSSFVHLAFAHRLADEGRIAEARRHVQIGLDTLPTLESEPVGSMLLWERARIAVLAEPDHEGVLDTWAYAELASTQVWELRIRRVEAGRDRLRIGRLRRDHERVEQAALEDPLTRTANRRRIDRERAALLDTDPDTWVTVIYLDIDDFKPVNDTHGHDLGDTVLRTVARLLHTTVREDDLVGRYGGDEFVIIAASCGPDEATELGARLLTAVRDHDWQAVHPGVAIRVSVGIACARDAHHRLFPAADEALYSAKRRGRDRAEHRVLTPVPLAS